MAHYNLYESLGLDRGKSASELATQIQQRLSQPGLGAAQREELEVAGKVLGNEARRSAYDAKLADPNAAPIGVGELRELSQAQFGRSVSQSAQSAQTAQTGEKDKPKQYFPDTDPNLEAVEAAQATYSPVPAQPGYPYPQNYTQNYPQGYAPATGYFPAPGYYPQGYYPGPGVPQQTGPEKKKGVSIPLVLAIVLALAGIGAGGWWLWDNSGTDYSPEAQAVADAFPALLPEQSGKRGFDNMKCKELEAENGQVARIRCSNRTLGLSVIDYGSESARDATLPDKDADIIGNSQCNAKSFQMDGVSPPAFKIAPEGSDSHYLLVINGDNADERKMYLNFCD